MSVSRGGCVQFASGSHVSGSCSGLYSSELGGYGFAPSGGSKVAVGGSKPVVAYSPTLELLNDDPNDDVSYMGALKLVFAVVYEDTTREHVFPHSNKNLVVITIFT